MSFPVPLATEKEDENIETYSWTSIVDEIKLRLLRAYVNVCCVEVVIVIDIIDGPIYTIEPIITHFLNPI